MKVHYYIATVEGADTFFHVFLLFIYIYVIYVRSLQIPLRTQIEDSHNKYVNTYYLVCTEQVYQFANNFIINLWHYKYQCYHELNIVHKY